MQLKGIIRLISQISRVSQVSQKYVFADVQSAMPITSTPSLAIPPPSTAVALHGPGDETTTTADQSTAPEAPPSLPRIMRSIWTMQMVTQCKWGSGLLKSRLCFLTSKNHKQDYKQRGTTTWG